MGSNFLYNKDYDKLRDRKCANCKNTWGQHLGDKCPRPGRMTFTPMATATEMGGKG